jgi:Holliday junction resolvase RusA-like endonuclease
MVQVMSREQDIERVFGVNHSIPFAPVAQARHRQNSNGQMYDPSSQLKIRCRMEVMRYLSIRYNISNYPLTTDSYVSVNITFLISRPNSHFIGNNRNNGIDPSHEAKMPTTQGDIDNFIKFFLDAIDGIFVMDDRYVVKITALKLFTTEQDGRTVFNVRHHDMNIVNLVDNHDYDEN